MEVCNQVEFFFPAIFPCSVLSYEHSNLAEVDECATGRAGCAQLCHNTLGSYLCDCHPGYIVAIDGKTCQGVFSCYILNDVVIPRGVVRGRVARVAL